MAMLGTVSFGSAVCATIARSRCCDRSTVATGTRTTNASLAPASPSRIAVDAGSGSAAVLRAISLSGSRPASALDGAVPVASAPRSCGTNWPTGGAAICGGRSSFECWHSRNGSIRSSGSPCGVSRKPANGPATTAWCAGRRSQELAFAHSLLATADYATQRHPRHRGDPRGPTRPPRSPIGLSPFQGGSDVEEAGRVPPSRQSSRHREFASSESQPKNRKSNRFKRRPMTSWKRRPPPTPRA